MSFNINLKTNPLGVANTSGSGSYSPGAVVPIGVSGINSCYDFIYWTEAIPPEDIYANWLNYPDGAGQWQLVEVGGKYVIRTTVNTRWTGFWRPDNVNNIGIHFKVGMTNPNNGDNDWIGFTFAMNKYNAGSPNNPYNGNHDAYSFYLFCLNGSMAASARPRHGGLYKMIKAPHPNNFSVLDAHQTWTGNWIQHSPNVWNDHITYFIQTGSNLPEHSSAINQPSNTKGMLVPLQRTNTFDLMWKRLDWVDVGILKEGNNIKVYVDGNLEIDYTDNNSPLGSGGYGPFAASQAHATFEDVSLIISRDKNTSIVATEDREIVAQFIVKLYELKYTAGSNGSVSGNTHQKDVPCGSNGTPVSAVPATNYVFDKWSDGRTDNPRVDTNVTANVNVSAQFKLASFNVTYSAGNGGSISGNTNQTIIYNGSGTSVTAVPDTGYEFVKWSDGNTNVTRSESNVTQNLNFTAEFKLMTFTVTYSAGGGGSILGNTSQTVYYNGSSTPVTAVPDTCYEFVRWSDGNNKVTRSESNVTQNLNFTAEFKLMTFDLRITPVHDPHCAGHTLHRNVTFSHPINTNIKVNCGEEVCLNVEVEKRWRFLGWRIYAKDHSWWRSSVYDATKVVYAVSGDFNGDGKSDIAHICDYGGGYMRIHVFLSDGSKFNFQGDSGWWASGGYHTNRVLHAVSGDFNGDGKDDIALIYDYAGHSGLGDNQTRIHVFLSDGSKFNYQTPNGWWGSTNYNAKRIAHAVCGDFNGDGKSDIAFLYDDGSSSCRYHVFLSDGSKFNYQGSSGWWVSSPDRHNYHVTELYGYDAKRVVHAVCGDFNGDGKDDIAHVYNYPVSHTRIHIFLSDGSRFNYQGDMGWWISSYGGYNALRVLNAVSGNFDGDSRDDVALLYDYGSTQNPHSRYHALLSDGTKLNYQSDFGWWRSVGYDAKKIAHAVSGDFSGNGLVDIANIFDYGDSQTGIHAFLSDGTKFDFLGDGSNILSSSSNNEFCFIVYHDIEVEAHFKPVVTLTIDGRGNEDVPQDYFGSVNIGFGVHWYDCDEYVYFCPSGKDPYIFSHFEGKDAEFYKRDVDGERCIPLGELVPHFGILMDDDKEVTCVFVDKAIYGSSTLPWEEYDHGTLQGTLLIKYVAGSGGSIEGQLLQKVPVTTQQPVSFFTTRVKAIPNANFEFDRWSDGKTSVSRREKSISGNTELTAYFKPTICRVEYGSGDDGSVVGDLIQFIPYGGDGEQVEAVPDVNHKFDRWSDGLSNPIRRDVGVVSNLNPIAIFKYLGYIIRYATTVGGSVVGELFQKIMPGEDGLEVTAVPDDVPNAVFLRWSDGVTDLVRKELDVNSNLSLTAIFKVSYTVVYIAGVGGEVLGDVDQFIEHGKETTPVFAKANSGYRFDGWSDGVSSVSRWDTNVISNLEITANFKLEG